MAERRPHDAEQENYTPRRGIRFPFPTERRTSFPTMPKETPLDASRTQTPQEAVVEETTKPKETKRNKVLKRAAGGIGAALLVATTALGVEHYVFEDNTSSANSPTTRSPDSVPGGTSFSHDGSVPEIIGLSPDLQSPIGQPTIETEQPKPDEKVNSEEVFDNEADKQKINKNNTYFLTPENIGQFNLKPVIDKEAGTITFLFPFKIADSISGRIDLTPLPIESPPVGQALFKFSTAGIPIVTPDKNVHVYLIRGKGVEEWGEDPNKAAQVRMYKYYEEAKTTVLWWFFDEKATTERYALNPLLPMQDFKKEVGRGTNWEKLPVVEDALTEVATTTEPNQPVMLNVRAYRGRIVGPDAEVVGDDFLLKPKFFTTDSDGNKEMLAIKK